VYCLDHSCFWHSFNMAKPSQSFVDPAMYIITEVPANASLLQHCPIHSHPDLRKGCVPRNFAHVRFEISRNSLQFNLDQFIFFISRAGKMTKSCFKMCNKRIK
jgi:hypothetical protein